MKRFEQVQENGSRLRPKISRSRISMHLKGRAVLYRSTASLENFSRPSGSRRKKNLRESPPKPFAEAKKIRIF